MSRALNILVVDDDEACQMAIRLFLAKTPHTLTFRENGQEAVDAVQTGAFDLVLMDLQMPVVDGRAAVREIRSWEAQSSRARLSIIALTANSTSEDIQQNRDAGFDHHIGKPIDQIALLAAIVSYANA